MCLIFYLRISLNTTLASNIKSLFFILLGVKYETKIVGHPQIFYSYGSFPGFNRQVIPNKFIIKSVILPSSSSKPLFN